MRLLHHRQRAACCVLPTWTLRLSVRSRRPGRRTWPILSQTSAIYGCTRRWGRAMEGVSSDNIALPVTLRHRIAAVE
jgi:hypothetical protein